MDQNTFEMTPRISRAADDFYESLRLVGGAPVVGHRELEELLAAHREAAVQAACDKLDACEDASRLSTLEEGIYAAAFVTELTILRGKPLDAARAAVAAHRTLIEAELVEVEK